MPSFKLYVLSGLALFLAGCVAAPKTAYYWGNYEPTIYHYFDQSISPDEQIAALEKDIATAQEKNQAIPPGVHAQLGMLYMQTGKESAGITQFQQEKSLFPESTHYLDFILKPRSNQKQSDTITRIAKTSPAQSNTQQTPVK